MPMLMIIWTTVVFLATVIYHVQLFRNKETQKYRNKFALAVVGLCIFFAICTEVFLRMQGFEMPVFVDAAIFYVKFFAIYGGAYGLIIAMKTKIIKVPIQSALVILMCASFYAQVWHVFPVVSALHQCPISDSSEDKTTVTSHASLATPDSRFWQELHIRFFYNRPNKCWLRKLQNDSISISE